MHSLGGRAKRAPNDSMGSGARAPASGLRIEGDALGYGAPAGIGRLFWRSQ